MYECAQGKYFHRHFPACILPHSYILCCCSRSSPMRWGIYSIIRINVSSSKKKVASVLRFLSTICRPSRMGIARALAIWCRSSFCSLSEWRRRRFYGGVDGEKMRWIAHKHMKMVSNIVKVFKSVFHLYCTWLKIVSKANRHVRTFNRNAWNVTESHCSHSKAYNTTSSSSE